MLIFPKKTDQFRWFLKSVSVSVLILFTTFSSAQTYITTEAQLHAIDSNPTGTYILSNDILLTSDWEPLASTVSFKGTLDGNNHIIRNLRIKKEAGNKIGFFSQVEGATIKNLGFEKASVEAGTTLINGVSVAILAGEAKSSTISNCYISGCFVSGRENVGSFIGSTVFSSGAASLIENCYSTSTVKATSAYAGGIIGKMKQTKIVKSYFSGVIENSGNYTGGIAGYVNGGTNLIARCVVLSPYLTGSTLGRVLGFIGSGKTTLQLNYARTDLKTGTGTYSNLNALPLSSCIINGLNGANVPMTTQVYNTSFPSFTDANANSALTTFNSYMLDPVRKLFYRDSSKPTDVAAIWTQAILWDMEMNYYKRTKTDEGLKLIENVYQGCGSHYANYDWYNKPAVWFIYDDIMWWVIAHARAYELLHDTKYLNLAKSGFDRVWNGSPQVGDDGSYADPAEGLGGGMFWIWDQSNPATPHTINWAKMACINYPTVIAAMTLFNTTGNVDYLNKAKEIYDWSHDNLFDSIQGRVSDSRTRDENDWTLHVYNQATCIGAAVMLYKQTGNDRYLNDAVLTADYTKNIMSKDGLLPFENNVEQGIYNAIFAQYISRLIEDCNQKQYLPWLKYNIDAGWGNRNYKGLTYKDFSVSSPTGTIESYDASGIPALMQVIPSTLESDKAFNAKSRFFYEKTLGWDFTSVWKFCSDGTSENGIFPVLAWQQLPLNTYFIGLPTDTLKLEFETSTQFEVFGSLGQKVSYLSSNSTIVIPEQQKIGVLLKTGEIGMKTGVANISAYSTVTSYLQSSNSTFPVRVFDPTEISTKIYTISDFNAIRNNLNGYYVLMTDIDASSYSNFVPFGRSSIPFTGKIFGNGHVVKNITINRPNNSDQGLFGYTQNAQIQDLGLENVNILALSDVGGLIGRATAGTIVRRVYVTGSIEGTDHVGTIAGSTLNGKLNTITDCYANANVKTNAYQAGGIVGAAQSVTVKNVYFTGSVLAPLTEQGNNAGGIVALNEDNFVSLVNVASLASLVKGGTSNQFVARGNALAVQQNNFTRSDMVLSDFASADHGLIRATVDQTKTLDIFKNQNFFVETLGWDFINIWKMPEKGFPVFNYKINTGFTLPCINNQNLSAFSKNGSVVCKVNQRAVIWIYQLNGILIKQIIINDYSEESIKLPLGFYFLKSLSNGKTENIKIINLK